MKRLAVVLLLVTACSNDPAQRAVPTTPPPVPTTTASPDPTPSPTPTFSITVEENAHFSTPTKNIGCYVGDTAVSCEIFRHDWPLQARPADCDADWGPGFSLYDGKVEIGHCGTDTVLSAERILAYGTGVEVGPFRCTSSKEGVTCVEKATGKGFFLSRASYRILP